MSRMLVSFLAACAVALACPAAMSHAQTPPGTQGGSAPSAPDVVRLRGGGMLRGTISERVPGERVVVVTVTGDIRTIPMAEVVYAGSASGDPGDPLASAAPPPLPTSIPEVAAPPPVADSRDWALSRRRLRPSLVRGVTLLGDNLTFFVRTGSIEVYAVGGWGGVAATGTQYRELCRAPCAAMLDPGTYAFALAEPGARPVSAGQLRVVAGSRVAGEYNNNTWARAVGWLVVVGSLIGGTAGVTAYMATTDGFDMELAPIITGLVIACVGPLIGGIIVALSADSASVSTD